MSRSGHCWSRFAAGVLLLAIAEHAARAQPPIRRLASPIAVSRDTLARVATVVTLSGGRVLANDVRARRLVLFDSTLQTFRILADSSATATRAYGSRPVGLWRWPGDSVAVVDPVALSITVLDATAAIGRTMAIPPGANPTWVVAGRQFGGLAVDRQGALLFRGPSPSPEFPPPSQRSAILAEADSVPLVRYTPRTTRLDTVSMYRLATDRKLYELQPDGRATIRPVENPLAASDDWGILSDGTLVVARGGDYHLDLIRPDGMRETMRPVDHAWHRLDAIAKRAFIDSVRAQRERASGPAAAGSTSATTGSAVGMQRSTRDPAVTPWLLVPADELPDYAPAFARGSLRVDREDRIWLQSSEAIDGAPVFDRLDRTGSRIDRVVLPAGREPVGFGRDCVYVVVRAGVGVVLEAYRIGGP